MEFSFDRANTSAQFGKAKETQVPNNNQQLNNSSDENVHPDGIDTSTIANERLRKAIERNRAKQAARSTQAAPSFATQATAVNDQASLFDKPNQVSEEPIVEEIPKHRAEERVISRAAASTGVVTRRSAARPNEAEFTPVKRSTRKVASQISYTTSSSRKK